MAQFIDRESAGFDAALSRRTAHPLEHRQVVSLRVDQHFSVPLRRTTQPRHSSQLSHVQFNKGATPMWVKPSVVAYIYIVKRRPRIDGCNRRE